MDKVKSMPENTVFCMNTCKITEVEYTFVDVKCHVVKV